MHSTLAGSRGTHLYTATCVSLPTGVSLIWFQSLTLCSHLSKNLHGCSPDVVESFFCCVLSLIPPGVTRTFTTDHWSSPLHRITQVERLPLTEEACVAPSEDVLTLFSGVVGCLTSSLISSLPGSKSAFLTELAEVCSRLRLEDQEIVLHNVLALLFSNNANVIMSAG